MKILTALTLALLGGVTPLHAATIEVTSRIDAVAVHPDGAVVTRIVEVDLPAGATTLLVKGIAATDATFTKVDGKGEAPVTILGHETTPDAPPASVAAMPDDVKRLRTLQDERAMVQGRVDAIETRRRAILRYVEASPSMIGDHPAPDALTQAWDTIGTSMLSANAALAGEQAKLRDLDEAIAPLQAKPAIPAQPDGTRMPESMTRGGLPPGMPPQPPGSIGAPRMPSQAPSAAVRAQSLLIYVEAEKPGRASFSVSYRTAAWWAPRYEAKLSTDGKPSVGLVRKAAVMLESPEEWSDVAMTVETTHLNRPTQAPKVASRKASFSGSPAPSALGQVMRTIQGSLSQNEDLAEEAMQMARAANNLPLQQARVSQAMFETNGVRQSFVVPGRVSVRRNGSMRVLRLSETTLDAGLRAEVAPRLDPTAYLSAEFAWKGEGPLFEGPVEVTRDGAAVGQGKIPFLVPGAKHTLGFGADDLISVERAPDKGRRTQTGLLNVTGYQGVDVETKITNRHTAPLSLRVSDALPYSEDPDLAVEQVTLTPLPTTTGKDADRGVLTWNADLAPAAAMTVRVAYTIKAPADRNVVFTPR